VELFAGVPGGETPAPAGVGWPPLQHLGGEACVQAGGLAGRQAGGQEGGQSGRRAGQVKIKPGNKSRRKSGRTSCLSIN
jgi:hypothetical protein